MSVTWFKTNRSRVPLGITRRVQPPSTDKKISSRVRSVQTISYQAKETFIVIVSSAIVLTLFLRSCFLLIFHLLSILFFLSAK